MSGLFVDSAAAEALRRRFPMGTLVMVHTKILTNAEPYGVFGDWELGSVQGVGWFEVFPDKCSTLGDGEHFTVDTRDTTVKKWNSDEHVQSQWVEGIKITLYKYSDRYTMKGIVIPIECTGALRQALRDNMFQFKDIFLWDNLLYRVTAVLPVNHYKPFPSSKGKNIEVQLTDLANNNIKVAWTKIKEMEPIESELLAQQFDNQGKSVNFTQIK